MKAASRTEYENQLRGAIGAYLLVAVVPLGAYAEQEDYFNQSAHGCEDPYRLFCADRPLIFPIPLGGAVQPHSAFIRMPIVPPSVTLLTRAGPYAELIDYGQRR